MTDRQEQKTGANSIAIQSGGSTNIGFDGNQVGQIINHIAESVLAPLIEAKVGTALETCKNRIQKCEEEIANTIKNGKMRAEAFEDPDFVFAARMAMQNFARSGDDSVGANLVELLARRSLETKQTRLTLSLNEALNKVPSLTKNEIAELSLHFLIQHTRSLNCKTIDDLGKSLTQMAGPLISDISTDHNSYNFMESYGCIRIEQLVKNDFRSIMLRTYGGFFARGFAEVELRKSMPKGKENLLDGTLIKCRNNASLYQFTFQTAQELRDHVAKKKLPLTSQELNRITRFVEQNGLSSEDLNKVMEKKVPFFRKLHQVWDASPLSHMHLTPVGFAIGHTNLRRFGILDDLSKWIT